MKILFVHEVSYTTKVVFEMHELPEQLAIAGHLVYFIDYGESHPRTGVHSLIRSGLNFLVKSEVPGRAFPAGRIELHTIIRLLPEPLGRLSGAVVTIFRARKWIRKLDPDFIVTYGVATNGWQLTRAGRRLQIPVIYRAIDVVPELRRTAFRPLIAAAEKSVVRNASMVIANNPVLQERLTKICPEQKILSMPPGFKLDFIRPRVESRDLKTVVFMGTLFRFSGLKEFIESYGSNNQAMSLFNLKIIGDGEDMHRLRKLVKKLKIDEKVEFTGFIGFDKLANALSSCDVALLPFVQNRVTNNALPAKAFQYIAAGLPVVSSSLAGLQAVLGEGCGITYALTRNDLLERVSELVADERKRMALVIEGQSQVRQLQDWQPFIEGLLRHAGDLRAR